MTFNDVSVAFSHVLKDKVTNGGDDGETYTAQNRIQFFHDAQRSFYQFWYDNYFSVILSETFDPSVDSDHLKPMHRLKEFMPVVQVTSDSDSLIDLSDALFSGYTEIFDVFNINSGVHCRLVPLADIPSRRAKFGSYVASRGNVLAYYRNDTLYIEPNDSHNQRKEFEIKFLKAPVYTHTAASLTTAGAWNQGGLILWNDAFLNDLINLSYAFAFRDNGDIQQFESIRSEVFSNYVKLLTMKES